MKHEQQLKLQAYLDGELPPREHREVAALVARDEDAQKLLAELRFTQSALKGNELEFKVPETREFYWSKIEREIQRPDTAPATRKIPWFTWWRTKYWIPFSGVAVMLALLLGTGSQLLLHSSVLEEIDSPSDETGAFTYRSDKDRMTVVWLYDRAKEADADSEEPEIDPEP